MGWRLGRLLTKMHKDRHGPKVRVPAWSILKIIVVPIFTVFVDIACSLSLRVLGCVY